MQNLINTLVAREASLKNVPVVVSGLGRIKDSLRTLRARIAQLRGADVAEIEIITRAWREALPEMRALRDELNALEQEITNQEGRVVQSRL